MKIGLIRERKFPADPRAPLTPPQCELARRMLGLQFVVEPSPHRCFPDDEYHNAGAELSEHLDDCDILLGLEEIPRDHLLPGKTCLMFSNTTERQPDNRMLLWDVLGKNIRLIDYGALKDDRGNPLISSARFAGRVVAHNALWAYGRRTGLPALKRMKDFYDYEEAQKNYLSLELPPVKIVLTGSGQRAEGAAQVLLDMGCRRVTPRGFLHGEYAGAVFTQLDWRHCAKRKDGARFGKTDFYHHPAAYQSAFAPFYRRAEILINSSSGGSSVPALFEVKEMNLPDFKIQVVAGIVSGSNSALPLPSAVRTTTVLSPVYGFNAATQQETAPFLVDAVDVMVIDNPSEELPRDVSTAVGQQLIRTILPELVKGSSSLIRRATIAQDGILTKPFRYLEDYAG